jgi:hypothetical protein
MKKKLFKKKKNCKSFYLKTAFVLAVFAVSLILISCSQNKDNIEKENEKSLNNEQTNENIPEQNNTKILFAGMNWQVNANESEFKIEGKYATSAENVFVDDEGKLHLKLKIVDNEPVGAEITVDSLLDLGEYIFFLDTKLSTFPKNCELLFRFCNPYEINGAGLAETGISIGFENSKIRNPIKYYAFNTTSRESEKHYLNAKNNLNTKHKNDTNGTIYKVILVNEAITFIALNANSNKENSQNKANLISEYTFSEFNKSKSKNELTFYKPSRKQKLFVNFNCFDASQKLEEFEVVISKILYKSSNSKATDYAANRAFVGK